MMRRPPSGTETPRCEAVFCWRTATRIEEGKKRLCGPHVNGEKTRQRNDQKRQKRYEEQQAAWALRNAQDTYRETWRGANTTKAYGRGIACELCGLRIQVTYAESQTADCYARLREHQQAHGRDWTDYQNAGREEVETPAS
jgi:hypothetical protein